MKKKEDIVTQHTSRSAPVIGLSLLKASASSSSTSDTVFISSRLFSDTKASIYPGTSLATTFSLQ